MNRLTIRWKITISSVVAVAIVLVGAFFLTHWQVSSILHASNATLASADLESFAADIMKSHGEHVDVPATGILVYVRDANGVVQLDTLPGELRGRVSPLAVANGTSEVHAGGVEYELVGEVVSTAQGDWDLWAARSNASIPVATARLDTVLALGLAVLLLLLAFASFLIASAALRPVTRLREAAQSLAVDSIDTSHAPRLPVGASRDEISQLAMTLNGFLSDIHSAGARERHMVSDAAHELRTPLAVLRTQLELAHGHFGDAQALEQEVTRAESSVLRLSSLASNLLELSRLEAGQVAPGHSTTDQLADEILAGVDRLRTIAAARALTIDFGMDSEIEPASVALDVMSFARVVDNLLSNAAAAVEPGTGQIQVRLYSVDHRTVMDVVDNGHGMPAEFVPKAFDRFSRPDFGRTSREGGAGLGLSLVQGIAVSAGGSASIIPQGSGVIVRVTLPNIR